MAVIGNRIRQILRILNADGQCTTRQIFDRLAVLNATSEVSMYMRRAESHGFVRRIEGNPARWEITHFGREFVADRVPGVRRMPQPEPPRGPASIWDYARSAA